MPPRYHGHWKLTSIEDNHSEHNSDFGPPQEFDGELKIASNGLLELFSYAPSSPLWTIIGPHESPPRKYLIHGEAKYNTRNFTSIPVTIFDAGVKDENSFTAKYAILGLHMTHFEEVRVSRLEIILKGLDLMQFFLLFENEMFDGTQSFTSKNSGSLKKIRLGNLGNALNSGVEVAYDELLSSETFLFDDEIPPKFYWNFKESISLSDTVSRINSFHKLLALFLGHPVEIEQVFLKIDNVLCKFLFPNRSFTRTLEFASPSFIRLVDLQDNFNGTLNKWGSLERKLPQVISQLIENIYSDEYTNARLFASLVALEQYHREMNPIDEKARSAEIQKTLNIISGCLDEATFTSIQTYFPEGPTLRKRYCWCLSALQRLKIINSTKKSSLAMKLANMRNGYGHTLNSPESLYHLVYYIQITNLTLQTLLFEELGLLSYSQSGLERQWLNCQQILDEEKKYFGGFQNKNDLSVS